MSNDQGMRQYWDDKIDWWADSSYEEKPRGPVDRLMANLRRSVHARAVVALDLLKDELPGKTVLDIGCGNGHFIEGCIQAGAARGIGIDIAPQAVELAQKEADRRGFGDKVEFHVGRAGQDAFPKADIVTGFGLVDWLEREECLKLFESVKEKKFVFSYSEMDGSFDEWVHYFYLIQRLRWFGDGVRAYHHPRRTILNRLRKVGIHDVDIVEKKEMRFGRLLHNLNASS